jgi:hypothetical protein
MIRVNGMRSWAQFFVFRLCTFYLLPLRPEKETVLVKLTVGWINIIMARDVTFTAFLILHIGLFRCSDSQILRVGAKYAASHTSDFSMALKLLLVMEGK